MTMTYSKFLTSSALVAGFLGAAVAAQADNIEWTYTGGVGSGAPQVTGRMAPGQFPGVEIKPD